MLTGFDIAGLVLATFPLVIAALEAYDDGFQQIKEWIRFKGEFAAFLNALARQKIFFRQNMEELLAPIVESDYEMGQLLDDPDGAAWKSDDINERLKQRLSGRYEYEAYLAAVKSIMELLEKLKQRLKIEDNQVREALRGCEKFENAS